MDEGDEGAIGVALDGSGSLVLLFGLTTEADSAVGASESVEGGGGDVDSASVPGKVFEAASDELPMEATCSPRVAERSVG